LYTNVVRRNLVGHDETNKSERTGLTNRQPSVILSFVVGNDDIPVSPLRR
jgi:hypothetical protein